MEAPRTSTLSVCPGGGALQAANVRAAGWPLRISRLPRRSGTRATEEGRRLFQVKAIETTFSVAVDKSQSGVDPCTTPTCLYRSHVDLQRAFLRAVLVSRWLAVLPPLRAQSLTKACSSGHMGRFGHEFLGELLRTLFASSSSGPLDADRSLQSLISGRSATAEAPWQDMRTTPTTATTA